ncbi:hypothetical protein [Roseivivax sp. CAU 1761]
MARDWTSKSKATAGGTGGTGGVGRSGDGGGKSYHNGGIEGPGLSAWYDAHLAEAMAGTDGSAGAGTAEALTVLDLSDAGAVSVINLTTDPVTGAQSGTVEFLGAGGSPVGWGHFEGIDEILLPEDPNAVFYTEADLEVIGAHGPGQPVKVALTSFIRSETPETGGTRGSGSGGTKGSGSGGTKGSGSGGTRGSGSGGTRGSGSGGTKGSGSGGTKGSGSGGTRGSGSGGTKGSGSGGTKGSGSGGTKGSGSGGTRGSGSGGTKGSGSGGTKGSASGGTKGSASGSTRGSGSSGTKSSGSGGTKGSGSGGTKGTGGADEGGGKAWSLPAFRHHPDDLTAEDVEGLLIACDDGEDGSRGTGWDDGMGDPGA